MYNNFKAELEWYKPVKYTLVVNYDSYFFKLTLYFYQCNLIIILQD